MFKLNKWVFSKLLNFIQFSRFKNLCLCNSNTTNELEKKPQTQWYLDKILINTSRFFPFNTKFYHQQEAHKICFHLPV